MAIDININSQILTYADITEFPATGSVKTIYIAEDSDFSYYWDGTAYIQLSGGGGGGNQDLQSVTDEGNTTTNNIEFDGSVGLLFDNSSKVTKGTTDANTGGSKGVALKCSIDYELKWEAGSLYVMEQDGFTIREVAYKRYLTPTVNDDDTKGFVEDSRWLLDNGDVYLCTDSTTGAAVWELQIEFTQIQSDWNQSDNTQVDYIKNKPSVLTGLGYYAQYQDDATQTAASSNVGYPMKFRTMDYSNEVTVASDSRITFANEGVYNLQFSSQFQNTDTQLNDVTIWLRKNGTDVAGSAGYCSIPNKHGGVDGHSIVSWNYLLEVNANDYYELVWSTTNHNQVTMQFYAAGNPPPSTASTIFTVTQQAGVMAETQLDRLHAFASPYDYNGHASQGSSESAAVWTITRLTIASDGTTTKGVATGAWTNRASLNYI